MKACEKCGEEIWTYDGDGLCNACDKAAANGKTRKGARAQKRMMESVMQDCGLVKVKGALGGTYWE